MHMLIRVVCEAYDAEDATGIAQGLFEGVDAPLYPTFDYGTLMTEGGRWSESLPDIFREEGSARADSEIGNDLLKDAWGSTTRELARRMAVIRKGFEDYTDKELLESPRIEADVEPWNPLGLAENEEEFIDSYSGDFRYAMYSVGEYAGPVYYLYNEYGTAIRSQVEFEQLLEMIATDDTGSDDTSFYVTPVDVHY
ncbi:MAG: hypothetical protein ACI8VE_000102 [Natrialbaceae archaeon]|jgi:hypothetical protein